MFKLPCYRKSEAYKVTVGGRLLTNLMLVRYNMQKIDFALMVRSFVSALTILITPIFLTSCDQTDRYSRLSSTQEPNLPTEISLNEGEHGGLPEIDLSVEFEDTKSARANLGTVASAISAGEHGIFYFKTSDDDMMNRTFMFILSSKENRLIKTVAPMGQASQRAEFVFNNAMLDQSGDVLTLETSAGPVVITVLDITPMGA